MKNLILAVAILSNALSYAQGIKPPSEGKSVVYFARTSGYGAIIEFTFLDSNRVIGQFNSRNYMRYECAPGEHLFWAYSETGSFVTAELESGKIYFLNVRPEIGTFHADVSLWPVDPTDTKKMEKIEEFVNERTPRSMTAGELERATRIMDKTITKQLEKYTKDVARGRKIRRVEKTMSYEKH